MVWFPSVANGLGFDRRSRTAVRSWKNATPQEQAAIIAALRAAADGDC
ncbi:hypothetical protein [Rhodococcus erythropolis]|uniref:Uncharacterized protein n=1 Tax=Rhodococcus erythropolis TaxID=1833 RepID=A0A8I0ZTL7_RHOER|nr:hypothetical protein [Rhodococcus erythropolis]MBH5141976.1 hypothetical protein [Rhodococcus erythropolis]MBH5145344.1 hypothetical protein [Rhodococcus erythropolis]MBH5145416.1 hypothetical protein [Rhodococcus erythropolis]